MVTAKKRSTANGKSVRPVSINHVITTNLLLERQAFLRKLLDPRRDIDAECGHPKDVSIGDYKGLWDRGDIAARVVSVLPEESWKESPDIFETEDEAETAFEKAWLELEKQFRLFSVLERLDILSGIGRFGILLLGIDDGKSLEQPAAMRQNVEGQIAEAVSDRKLLYVRPFDESLVQVGQLESDSNNPRYGLPVTYKIQFEDATGGTSIGGPASPKSFNNTVHWTRVIHVTDNRMSSDVYGIPRMQRVLNRLLDIRKIAGGSGEMFWRGGFPGLSLEAGVDPGENVIVDMDDIKNQLEAYMNGLQRYLALTGVQAKSLAPQVADPSPHIDGQIKLIAMTLGVPWRIFVGSEAAQLASEQDTRSWNSRLSRRRNEYLTPYVITPLIDRLVSFGVLPPPKELQVHWPDLNSLSDMDKAAVAERQTNAIARYVQAGADALISPFHFLTLVMGFEDDEARAIADEAEQLLRETDPEDDGEGGRGTEDRQPPGEIS